jgi:hypothetical protein
MLAVLNVSFGESTVTSVWFWPLDGGEASSIKSLLSYQCPSQLVLLLSETCASATTCIRAA